MSARVASLSRVTARADADSPPAIIEASALTKRFGDFTAVDAIDVQVHAGESFGFL